MIEKRDFQFVLQSALCPAAWLLVVLLQLTPSLTSSSITSTSSWQVVVFGAATSNREGYTLVADTLAQFADRQPAASQAEHRPFP